MMNNNDNNNNNRKNNNNMRDIKFHLNDLPTVKRSLCNGQQISCVV